VGRSHVHKAQPHVYKQTWHSLLHYANEIQTVLNRIKVKEEKGQGKDEQQAGKKQTAYVPSA
jgi:hypothetical protein